MEVRDGDYKESKLNVLAMYSYIFHSWIHSHLELAELLDGFISSLIGSLNLSLQIFYVCLQLLLGCCCCGPLLAFILQLGLQLTNL